MSAFQSDLSLGLREKTNIAIVHEWVDAYAGSEQVFEALAQMFPSADLYALTNNPHVHLDVGNRVVRTTFLDHAVIRDRRNLTLPVMPIAWWQLGHKNYDLVITSHHAFAQSNRLAGEKGRHLVYVHSPARYLWSPEIDARGDSLALRPVKALLRSVDKHTTTRVAGYAANSTVVAQRIRSFWGRESRVIHPPVRTQYFSAHSVRDRPRDYVLGFGRWIPYKGLHLVIEAASLVGMPVKIAGRGPDRSRILQAAEKARVPVELIHSPNDDQLRELYANAACLVFPTIEDFGIVPVEAQAAGTPVVAPAAGGALDTVRPGESGVLVPSLDPAVLANGIRDAMGLSAEACLLSASRFSRAAFERNIREWIDAR